VSLCNNGGSVVVDVSGCMDLRLCANQIDPAAVVNCTKKTVTKLTDATGIVRFTLLGGSIGTLSAGQGSGPLQGRIYVAGYENESVSMVGPAATRLAAASSAAATIIQTTARGSR